MTPYSPTNVLIKTKKCPLCNWQMRTIHEPISDERFSVQFGGLVQEFKTKWECPACGFVVPSTDEDVPF